MDLRNFSFPEGWAVSSLSLSWGLRNYDFGCEWKFRFALEWIFFAAIVDSFRMWRAGRGADFLGSRAVSLLALLGYRVRLY
jgi:hypothetical protein